MANKDQVLALHVANPGWCSADIARALHCDAAYVRATAQRCGIVLPKAKGYGRGRKPIPNDKAQAIIDDLMRGEKIDAIALHLGVSRATIANVARREGIPERRLMIADALRLWGICRKAGLTAFDIEAWARSRGGDAHA